MNSQLLVLVGAVECNRVRDRMYLSYLSLANESSSLASRGSCWRRVEPWPSFAATDPIRAAQPIPLFRCRRLGSGCRYDGVSVV